MSPEGALAVVVGLLMAWNYWLMVEFPGVDVKSSFDGKTYEVKRRPGSDAAANILARLNYVNTTLIDHLQRKYGGTARAQDIKFLQENYNGDNMSEHTPRTTTNTSYVLNKGDAIKLCLRDAKTGDFHDFNTLLFVNLHELSHMLDKQYGHLDTFWRGFAFILREAHEIGLYTPIDYSRTPVNYCGLDINSNPYWDVA
jgi:hypothetical protein